jgi:predicted nucleic-acid-binding Zn-ribbon protein
MQNNMEEKKCYVCGKTPLSKDEVGLTKKLIDKKTKIFYCISCLAESLEVTEEELLAKVEEFKNEGCTLFK